MKYPKHEWQCVHAMLSRYSNSMRFTCVLKDAFCVSVETYQRGCFGSECWRNGKINRFFKCPLARNNGVCNCLNEDGSSTFCQFGEKEIRNDPDTSCSRWRISMNPLGCTFGRMKTDEEMLLVANTYIRDRYSSIFGRNQMFATWFVRMLKYIGAPKEIYECTATLPEITGEYKTEEWEKSKAEYDKVFNLVYKPWKSFYNKRMKEIKNGKTEA